MIDFLIDIDLNWQYLDIFTKLYWDQSAAVRTESGEWNEFEIKKGVWKDYVWSPSLFNLYNETIFREVEDLNGVTIIGIKINNLRYADNAVLLCFCPNDIQMLLEACNESGNPYGMEMNIKKTKTMVISKTSPSPRINITLEGRPIQQTNSIKYLVSLIIEGVRCDKEVKRRV